MTVGRRLGHHLGADQPGAADPVLDHHRLAERLGEDRRDDARAHVHRAAGRVRRDDAHRLRRPGLRLRSRRERERDRRKDRSDRHFSASSAGGYTASSPRQTGSQRAVAARRLERLLDRYAPTPTRRRTSTRAPGARPARRRRNRASAGPGVASAATVSTGRAVAAPARELPAEREVERALELDQARRRRRSGSRPTCAGRARCT